MDDGFSTNLTPGEELNDAELELVTGGALGGDDGGGLPIIEPPGAVRPCTRYETFRRGRSDTGYDYCA